MVAPLMKLGTEAELMRVFDILISGALICMLAAAGSGISFSVGLSAGGGGLLPTAGEATEPAGAMALNLRASATTNSGGTLVMMCDGIAAKSL